MGKHPQRQRKALIDKGFVSALAQERDNPSEHDHIVVQHPRRKQEVAVTKSACESTGSRLRQNVQTTAPKAQADTTAWTIQAKLSGKPIRRTLTKAEATIGQPLIPATLSNSCRRGITFCQYCIQISGPNHIAVAATSNTVVATAELMTRQCPPNTNNTGSSSPNCGLIVRIPNKIPAMIGRRSRFASPPIKSAAVKNPFWPRNTFTVTAGAIARNNQYFRSTPLATAAHT